MPWYFPWSDAIKKRACRYLLQHYMGQFLKEKLTLDQLSVDLYSGRGTVTNVNLDVASLNEALDTYNVPIEIVDGYIGSISVTIPWSALLSDSTIIDINKLELTIQPKQRNDNNGAVLLDSMFSSMTTSMQLAQECLKQEPSEGEQRADNAQPFDGLEMFAQTIEAVLSKTKVHLLDTIVRLEHVQQDSANGTALEIKIARLEYFDDHAASPAATDTAQSTFNHPPSSTPQGFPSSSSPSGTGVMFEASCIAIKNVHLMGVKIYCDDLRSDCRTVSRYQAMKEWTEQNEPSTMQFCTDSLDLSFPSGPTSTLFSLSSSSPSPLQGGRTGGADPTSSPPRGGRAPHGSPSGGGVDSGGCSPVRGGGSSDLEPVLIAVLGGKQQIKLKIKQNEKLPGAKIELDSHVGSVNVHLSPHLIHLLTDLLSGISSPASSSPDCGAKFKDHNMGATRAGTSCPPGGSHHDPSSSSSPSALEQHALLDDFDQMELEMERQLECARRQITANEAAASAAGIVRAAVAGDGRRRIPSLSSYDGMTTQSLDDDDDDNTEDGEVYLYAGDNKSGGLHVDATTSYSVNYKKPAASSSSSRSAVKPGRPTALTAKNKSNDFSTKPPSTSPSYSQPSSPATPLDTPPSSSTSELSHVRLKISFLSVVLLHEDPTPSLSPPTQDLDRPLTSTDRLKQMSEAFFSTVLSSVMVSGVVTSAQMLSLREQYSRACPVDHIGLLCKPITVDLINRSSSLMSHFTADLSIGLLDLVEAVFDRRASTASFMGFHLPIENILPEYCELLTFRDADDRCSGGKPTGTGASNLGTCASSMYSSMSAVTAAPCLKIKFRSAANNTSSSSSSTNSSNNYRVGGGLKKDVVPPVTDIHVDLFAPCRIEIDITIVDRIHALLNPPLPLNNLPPPGISTSSGGRGVVGGRNTSLYMSAYQSMLHPSALALDRSLFTQTIIDDDTTTTDRMIDVLVKSTAITLDIRFPALDLSTGQGLDKPWWRRSLEPERLLFELEGASLKTSFDGGVASGQQRQIEFTCKTGHGLFRLSPNEAPISFIRIGRGDCTDREEGFDLPRMVVRWFPLKQRVLDDHTMDESYTRPRSPSSSDSLDGMGGGGGVGGEGGMGGGFEKSDPSPFSSKKVMYETEELKMPGDKHDMSEFAYTAINNTRLLVDLSLPDIAIFLPSKHFLELLYNRLLNDLVLWTPAAPTPLDILDGVGGGGLMGSVWSPELGAQLARLGRTGEPDMYSFCKSSHQYDSNSDTDEAEEEEIDDDDDDGRQDGVSSTCFYSMADTQRRTTRQQQRLRQLRQHEQQRVQQQSKMCVTVDVGHAKLFASMASGSKDGGRAGSGGPTVSGPTTGASGNTVGTGTAGVAAGSGMSGTCGEFMLEVDELNLLAALSYNGDPELQFISLQINTTELYHAGGVPCDRCNGLSVDEIARRGTDHLQRTIYLSDERVETKLKGRVGQGGDESLDMLSLAVKITSESFRNVKNYLIALGLRGATLRYRMEEAGRSWFTQILDFFDLVDYPINGYTVPKVITELHAHLWSCAIDYRPLHLPFRALLTVEEFSISSNIIVDSTVSLLRFLVTNGVVYLSDKIDVQKVDVKKNYVCVLDVGMFELALRSSSGKDPRYPKLELRASNNVLKIRTCSDTFAALSRLVNYLAAEMDLTDPSLSSSSFSNPSGHTSATETTSLSRISEQRGVPRTDSALSLSSGGTLSVGGHSMSDSQVSLHDQMSDLMADAMLESDTTTTTPATLTTQDGARFTAQHSNCTVGGGGLGDWAAPSALLKQHLSSPAHSCLTSSDLDPLGRILLPSAMVSPNDSYMSSSMGSSYTPRPPTSEDLDVGDEEEEGEEEGDGDDDDDDEEFCIVDEPGYGRVPRNGEPIIHVHANGPITIVDNHFSKPMGKTDLLKAPDHFPPASYRYTLKEISIVWYMYGGRDFESTPPEKTNGSPKPTARSVRSTESTSLGKLGWQARGGLSRDINTLMELQLNKLRFQHEQYPDHCTGPVGSGTSGTGSGTGATGSSMTSMMSQQVTGEVSSRQVLLVGEMEIRDRLASSRINKFLYQYTSETMPRQSHANMLMIKALHCRTEPRSAAQHECLLKVSIQPLRLNIDQDALFFFRTFFSEISRDEESVPPPSLSSRGHAPSPAPSSSPAFDTFTSPQVIPGSSGGGSRAPSSVDQPPSFLAPSPRHASLQPIMTVGGSQDDICSGAGSLGPPPSSSSSQEMLMLFDELNEAMQDEEGGEGGRGRGRGGAEGKRGGGTTYWEGEAEATSQQGDVVKNDNMPIFFKSFVFTPDVPIRLDYQGKWVDMEQGTLMGILVGLAQLNCSELKLKRLNHRHGLLGVDRLITFALNEWISDIKKNQLPSLLGGVGPLYSLVQLVQGCRDLVWLPVEQYRKDGRIIRGLQRGAHSFMTCTAMSTLELTNRLVQTVQFAAEVAFDMVSPGPSVSNKKKTSKRHRTLNHPVDLREGVANAYTIVKEGFCGAATDMYHIAVVEHEHKGVTGAVGGILRQIPSTVIEPVIIATEATSNVMCGMRNQLLPDRRREDEEKWKPEDTSSVGGGEVGVEGRGGQL